MLIDRVSRLHIACFRLPPTPFSTMDARLRRVNKEIAGAHRSFGGVEGI
jgi:hypothetical protein